MQVRPLVKVTQLNSRNVFIIIAVMMLIVLSIALVSVAFVQNDELSEDNDDFLEINGWVAICTTALFSQMLSIAIPRMGVFVPVLCAVDLGGGILAPP